MSPARLPLAPDVASPPAGSPGLRLWEPEAGATPRTLRPDQAPHGEQLVQHFAEHERGILHHFTAAGKTTTSCWVAKGLCDEAIAQGDPAPLVIAYAPTIDNAEQWLNTAKAVWGAPMHLAAICSDPNTCPDGQVSTDPALVADWLSQPRTAPLFVSCTHASARVLRDAVRILRETGRPVPTAVLKIVDEAHHTAGVGASSGGQLALLPNDHPDALPGRVMSVTATMREVVDLRPTTRKTRGASAMVRSVYSMDDPAIYGPVVRTYTLEEGQQNGVAPPVVIVPMAVRRRTLDRLEQAIRQQTDPDAPPPTSETLAATWVAAQAMHRYGVQQTLTFHNRVADAVALRDCLTAAQASGMAPATASAQALSGRTPAPERRTAVQRLRDHDFAGPVVTASADVFAEAVDLPRTDAVLAAGPKKSLVRWAQVLGRGMRPQPGKTTRVFCPVIVEDTGEKAHIGPTSHALLEDSLGYMLLYAPHLRRHIEPDTNDLDDLPVAIPRSEGERNAMSHSGTKLTQLFAQAVTRETAIARQRVTRAYHHVFHDHEKGLFHANLTVPDVNAFGEPITTRLFDAWFETGEDAAKAIDAFVLERGINAPLNFVTPPRTAKHARAVASADAPLAPAALASPAPGMPVSAPHTPSEPRSEAPSIRPARQGGVHFCPQTQKWTATAGIHRAGHGRYVRRTRDTFEAACATADALARRYALDRQHRPNYPNRLPDVRETLQNPAAAKQTHGFERDPALPDRFFAFARDGERHTAIGHFATALEALRAAEASEAALRQPAVAARRARLTDDPSRVRAHQRLVRHHVHVALEGAKVQPVLAAKRQARSTVLPGIPEPSHLDAASDLLHQVTATHVTEDLFPPPAAPHTAKRPAPPAAPARGTLGFPP